MAQQSDSDPFPELTVPSISVTAPGGDRSPNGSDEGAKEPSRVMSEGSSRQGEPKVNGLLLQWKTAVRSSSESGLPVSPTTPRSPKAFRSLVQKSVLVRSKSDKLLDGGDKWTAMMSVLKRKNYVPPPYASFVSRQLHKYLTLVNPEDNETATGFSLSGAVLFSDASGFTALTERLAARPNGAEELCEIINKFFAQLIEIVDKYAGDIVKFAGDAVCIVWAANAAEAAANNGYTSPDLATATLRACACCIELHQALHDYVAIDDPNPANRVLLQLHMGLGCGPLTAVHVGGVFRRWEYILAGSPMAQIAIAAPMARPGETVVSAEAWELVRTMVSGISVAERPEDPVPSQPNYHVLVSVDVDVPIPLFPTLLPITDEVRELMKRYIPHAVLPKLDSNHSGVLAELRDVSVVFVNVYGVELGAPRDDLISESVQMGQSLMLEIQRTVYSHEGSINKLLVDDKGLLVLCAWGLPPMPHPDDAVRSVAAALDLVENLKRLGEGVHGRVGVATGKAFCGVVGSLTRREYTLMGDSVNLAARLMSAAEIDGVLVDETTQGACAKLANNPFTFKPLAEKLYLKGKAALVNAFHPIVAPMVGPPKQKVSKKRENNSARDKEIKVVTSSLSTMIEQKGGVMFVTGDRGSGKTVLVDRLMEFGTANKMVVVCSQDNSSASTKYVPNDQNVQRHLERHYERLKKTSELEIAADASAAAAAAAPKLFTAWRTIIEELLRHACEATGKTRSEWIFEALRGRGPTDENLTYHARLLSLVIPDVEGFDRRPSERSDVLAVLEAMLARLLVAFADNFCLLIVLHLKTGTAAATAVDPESWSLAQRVSKLCVNRSQATYPMVLCVSTRPVTKARAESDVKMVFNLAQETGCVMMLKPLDSFARDKYAAQVLGIETQREIPVVAMPPILLQFLSDRAAGNPKHIQEMTLELLNSKSPAVRVLDNGRIEVLRSLDTVETPLKVRGAVKQEYDLLPVELQSVCRAAIGLRSFTPFMIFELMKSAADLDVGSRPCAHQEVVQYFADLVEFGVFETTQQPTQCVRRYYPRDMANIAFQFVSRLLQNEIAQYQPAVWRNRLEAVVRERTERVMNAYERLIRFFRRIRNRRQELEQKRLFRAAYVIQSKFRQRLFRRQASADRLQRQNSFSAMPVFTNQPINLTVSAASLKMPSRLTTPSPTALTPPAALLPPAAAGRAAAAALLLDPPPTESVVDEFDFSEFTQHDYSPAVAAAAVTVVAPGPSLVVPPIHLANGHPLSASASTTPTSTPPPAPTSALPAQPPSGAAESTRTGPVVTAVSANLVTSAITAALATVTATARPALPPQAAPVPPPAAAPSEPAPALCLVSAYDEMEEHVPLRAAQGSSGASPLSAAAVLPPPSAAWAPNGLLSPNTARAGPLLRPANGHRSPTGAASAAPHGDHGVDIEAIPKGMPMVGELPSRTPTPQASIDSASARDSLSPSLGGALLNVGGTRRASQPAAFDPSVSLQYPPSPSDDHHHANAPGSPFSKSTSAPPTILRRLSSNAVSPFPGNLSPARSFVTINNTLVVRNTGRRLPQVSDSNA